MRTKIFSLMLCAAAMLLASCGSETETNDTTDSRVALQVSGGINVQSRASNAAWEAGDQIGIYMFAAGTTTIAEGARNIPYETKTDNGRFTPTSAYIYFPIDGSNVDFHAWYPYKKVTSWEADLTNQSSQAAIDLMTADAPSKNKAIYNKENPTVHCDFRHRLTKIVLNIAPGTGVTLADLTGLKVEITKQLKTVLYAPESDALSFTEEATDITLLTKTDGTSAEAILFPDNLIGNPTAERQLVFTLPTTEEEFYWNIPNSKSFNAGEKNIYNITVNRTGLDVTSKITDWTPGNGAGEPGSAE